MSSGPNPEAEDETELAPDPLYVSHLSEHVHQTLAHYTGNGSASLPPSFFPPSGYWSSAEKDAFFHGLIIHSRLRPDLIAAEIKTKTMTDVCVYLDMLDEASSGPSAGLHPDDMDVDGMSVVTVSRKDLPAAIEASDEWVAVEERKALAIIQAEPAAQDEEFRNRRDEYIRTFKNSIRARKGEARTASNDRDREGERRRKVEFDKWLKKRQEEWAVEDVLRTLDIASMQALDRILREDEDRRTLNTSSDAQQSRGLESSDQGAVSGHQISTRMEVDSEQQTALPPLPSMNAHEIMIDPVLLALSQPSQVQCTPHVIPSLPISTQAHFQPRTPPFLSNALPPDVDHTAQVTGPSCLHSITTSALHTHPLSTVAPIIEESKTISEADELASLSPASRRRHKKKLYMRRKRAQATGAPVEETIERLKPGRKGKQRATIESNSTESDGLIQQTLFENICARQEPLTEVEGICDALPDSRAPSQAAELAQQSSEKEPSLDPKKEEYRHPHISGLTRTYKSGAQLAAVGIDADWMYDEGIALFHLKDLAKLMRLSNSLHDVPISVCSQISLETIKLLHVFVVKFITQVICRAIVLEEQERIAKSHTKVWRLSDNELISAENVQRALSLLGYDGLSKEKHFETLLDRINGASDSDEDNEENDSSRARRDNAADLSQPDDAPESPSDEEVAIDEGENQDDDPSADGEEVTGQKSESHAGMSPPPLSLHRTIFPPFVRIPQSMTRPLRDRVYPSEEQLYLPIPSYDDSEPIDEEDLMPLETDMDALAEELLEEENIDKRDRLVDELHEKSLWAKFGRDCAGLQDEQSLPQTSRKRKREQTDEDEDSDARAMRQREPARNSRIKSAAYVIDSD